MFVKIGIAVTMAVALLAVAPNPSFAASKKRHTRVTDTCGGEACTFPNPDRVQQCAGGDPVSCYKHSRTRHLRKRS
jgi:hypothetical protein